MRGKLQAQKEAETECFIQKQTFKSEALRVAQSSGGQYYGTAMDSGLEIALKSLWELCRTFRIPL